MNDILLILAVITIGLGGMFSFIYLLDQKSKAQARTGKPSRLIRLSAMVMGLAGIGASLWLEVGLPWFVLPLSLWGENDARLIVQRYRVGAVVTVHYYPARSGIAALEPGGNRDLINAGLTLAFFVVPGLLFLRKVMPGNRQ